MGLMPVTDSMFMLPESREQPMHVGGLQVFDLPEGSGPEWLTEAYQRSVSLTDVAPAFRRRAYRSPLTLGQWAWAEDRSLDLEHHVRHSALPRPGRVRELFALVSRLHATLLDRERPLWECAPHRGARGRPLRRLHEDPPRPDGRRLRHEAHPAEPRPVAGGRVAPAVGGATAPDPPARRARSRARRAPRAGPVPGVGRRRPAAPVLEHRRQRAAGPGRRAARAGPAQPAQRLDQRLPAVRRRRLVARRASARSPRRPTRPSTTSSSPCARPRCATTCSRSTRCPPHP